MIAGSATAFFAYTGFDAVASTAEEVYIIILISCFTLLVSHKFLPLEVILFESLSRTKCGPARIGTLVRHFVGD